LNRQADTLQHALNGCRVHRRTLKGAVQVDDMQLFEAGFLERAGLRGRIIAINRGLIHFAAAQAHAMAVLQVYGGK